MPKPNAPWDYLFITASNERQAASYREQLDLRRRLGFLSKVGEVVVVPDPGGRRIGSGGSTLLCLLEVLNRELPALSEELDSAAQWIEILQRLRILIIHAGGDSKRLPPYGPSGKIFVPLPIETDSGLSQTIFDRQLPAYLTLPQGREGSGQVVITTGDVLLEFDPEKVRFDFPGITGLGSLSPPDQASRHGVFCPGEGNSVRLFLQKPSVEDQKKCGAVDRHGRSVLDIGVMSLDAEAAARLLSLIDPQRGGSGVLEAVAFERGILSQFGFNFYREVCCGLGTAATREHYLESCRKGGSKLPEDTLIHFFQTVNNLPFNLCSISKCVFLHFGTLRQLITSGHDLLSLDKGVSAGNKILQSGNTFASGAGMEGHSSWIEGCRIAAPLRLEGENVMVGVDVNQPLNLPERAALDVLEGTSRRGERVWFVRCMGTDDLVSPLFADGGTYCNHPFENWLEALGASESDVFEVGLSRSLWNARLFPAVENPQDFIHWLWMFRPVMACREERESWFAADRYSCAEIAGLADYSRFHERRLVNQSRLLQTSIDRFLGPASEFSAAELGLHLSLADPAGRQDLITRILRFSYTSYGREEPVNGLERFELSRILHALGSATLKVAGEKNWNPPAESLATLLNPEERQWIEELGISTTGLQLTGWGNQLRECAFQNLGQAIVSGGRRKAGAPRNVLRSDEIVWGRAPARLDLGGGWSDTPPYSLEQGGSVVNVAVDLNGQPPIHVYARILEEPVIRLCSIDHSTRLTIHHLDDLCDYRDSMDGFSLAKAALALSGFAPEWGMWPAGVSSLEYLLASFGGGIELTTLAAIPSGSGLGTSSIMGAVLISVVSRVLGVKLNRRDLFNKVLQLEQELTTGGGWQDQIGGVVGGVKLVRTEPGLIPDPTISFIPNDSVDPSLNGGATLLYYTGLRRLAKNILKDVVGDYLDRNRASLATLEDIHRLPKAVVDALSRKDLRTFGELIDVAWRLNNRLDPGSTTPEIEAVLNRIRPHIWGAKLLGAGGGGFLFIVCRSPADAGVVRTILGKDPPNDRARFFEFSVSQQGLEVTVC